MACRLSFPFQSLVLGVRRWERWSWVCMHVQVDFDLAFSEVEVVAGAEEVGEKFS